MKTKDLTPLNMTNKKSLQRKGTEAFLAQDFARAFQIYERAYWLDEEDLDTLIGLYLSDIAMDYKFEAIEIFELYQNAMSCHSKSQKRNVACLILDIIKAFDNKINTEVKELEDNKNLALKAYDMLDAMSYDELKLALDSGNFKDIFNYILVNTKLIFYKKSDFYEFLSLLVQNDYLDMSMYYIDNLMKYDDDIIPIIEAANKKLKDREKNLHSNTNKDMFNNIKHNEDS